MFSLGVSSEEASALLLRWLCLVQDKFCVRVPAWRAVLEELGETSSCVGAQNQLPNNNVKLLMLWHKHGKVWRCYPQKQSPDLEAAGGGELPPLRSTGLGAGGAVLLGAPPREVRVQSGALLEKKKNTIEWL